MSTVEGVAIIGPARYGVIEVAFDGVSCSTLSTVLGELTEPGILSRKRYAELPARVEDEPTETGDELFRRFYPVLGRAEENDLTDE